MSDTVKAIILPDELAPLFEAASLAVMSTRERWAESTEKPPLDIMQAYAAVNAFLAGGERVELRSAYLENTAPSGQTFMGFWSGDHTFHGQGPFLVGEWKKVDDE